MTEEAKSDTPAVELDLNDPGSWPSDVAGLAGLVDADPPAAVAPGADDARGGAAAAVGTEARDKAAAGTDGKAGAAAAADVGKEPDPVGVLARDNKNIIPYSVLDGERKARQALVAEKERLEGETATLKAELATLKAGKPVGEVTEKPVVGGQEDDLPVEIRNKLAVLREDYGDDFADSYLSTWRTAQQVASVAAWIENAKAEKATTENATRQTQELSIQEAIDAVPVLAEWQVDTEHPEWYRNANQLHEMLMQTSADYKAMGWAQRMAALPAKVEAVYGESPHSAKRRTTTDNAKTAADVIAAAGVRYPTSMSEIPGGERPAASEAEKLEGMSPAQLLATMNNAAARGPDGLERFLNTVSAG